MQSLDVERVREVPRRSPPALVHPGWAKAFPWLVHGTTTRGADDTVELSGPGTRDAERAIDLSGPTSRRTESAFDLGLFSGGSPESSVRAAWAALLRSTGMERAVHARQPHGADVRAYRVVDRAEAGRSRGRAVPTLVEPCDGHVTDEPGILLAVTTADCVPVFLVDPSTRAVGMIHAGWRGTAAGVLERGLAEMAAHFGSAPAAVHAHLGPAICGSCYEVGPEVFEAVGLEPPAAPTPIDLRAVLARRAVDAGVSAERISVSLHCTRCTGSDLFSHRGGDAGRQAGFVGIVASGGA